jgi:hypothetical protein
MAFKIDTISISTFSEKLARYPGVVPEKLQSLDEARYNTIPTAITNTNQADSDVYLYKNQVETLVEWKLYVCPFLRPHRSKADGC